MSLTAAPHAHGARGLILRTLSSLHDGLNEVLYLDEAARGDGFLRRLDPRTKLVGFGCLAVAIASANRLGIAAWLAAAVAAIGVLARLPLGRVLGRTWLALLGFAAVLGLPLLFLTPGDVWVRMPEDVVITRQGADRAGVLMLRMWAAGMAAAILILSTPWVQVLKGMRLLRVPAPMVTILALTVRYIVLLLRTAQEMFEARESRRIGELSGRQERRLAISGIAVLLAKAMMLSEEVYLAMRSRGFHGEFFALRRFHMRTADWAGMAACVTALGAALWLR